MNDWADYALQKLAKLEQDQHLKDEKLVATQKLLNSRGIAVWHEIRRIVRENIESLNSKAGKRMLLFEVTQNTILRVQNVSNRQGEVLHATFDTETGQLEWDCGSQNGSWTLSVSDDGGVRFYWGMVPTTPASIAKQMLDALLFG